MSLGYVTKARIFPTVIMAPPVLCAINVALGAHAPFWLSSPSYLALFGKTTVASAVVYFLSQINRFIGAEVVERVVTKKSGDFPTTRLLFLGNEGLSIAMRNAISKKTEQLFGVALPTQVSSHAEPETGRTIADFVARMRGRTRSHKLLLQHNIEYGFWRNLIGAAPVTLLASIACVFLHRVGLLGDATYKMVLLYVGGSLLLMAGSPFILGRLSVRYAHALFEAFLDVTG
ncbi:MAG: hypothetical protein M0Z85_03960 [Gammaproteobacteria bacterium]|jgi:hypothetical protein|nr:hypothetical protein [Gammaproteobacteria bacterium]